jgi:hypothetical protein
MAVRANRISRIHKREAQSDPRTDIRTGPIHHATHDPKGI